MRVLVLAVVLGKAIIFLQPIVSSGFGCAGEVGRIALTGLVALTVLVFSVVLAFPAWLGIGTGVASESHRPAADSLDDKVLLGSLSRIVGKCEKLQRKFLGTFRVIR